VKSRRARRRILEGVAEAFEAVGELAEAQRARRGAGDAGLYLDELAVVEQRQADFLRRVEVVRSTLDRDGRWSEANEWRIATGGTEAIEATGSGFRIVVDYHGTFTGDFATFAEAYEATSVLGSIQKDLFYAVGWSSWEGRPREDDKRLEYLYRLAREARAEAVPALDDELVAGRRTFRRSAKPWGEDGADVPVVEVEVRDRSLLMRCASPTVERAAEFAGIYERLQADLASILDWRWL
jgi:hypothetical protein